MVRINVGAYRDGWASVERGYDEMMVRAHRSGLLRSIGWRAIAEWGAASVAVASEKRPSRALRAVAARNDRFFRGQERHMAGLDALRRGDLGAAADALREAVAAYEREGAPTFVALSEWALTFATDDTDKRADLEAWLTDEGVVNVPRFTAYHNADLGKRWQP